VRPVVVLRVAAATGVIALGAVLVWRVTHQPKSVLKAVSSGRVVKAPNFDLPRLDAKGKLTLASLRGKAVVLNFWQSSCGPCKQEMPRLEAGAKRWARRDVVVVGIDMLDARFAGEAFRKRYGATYPMVLDALANTQVPFGILGTPTTFFIDKRGRIVKRVQGPVSTAVLDAGIAHALAT
jgi:cytochrome c biogenesis protein CcmG, thiol:disulfide interchange protein DsbE